MRKLKLKLTSCCLNVVWLKAKEEAWKQITEEFNAANAAVSRTPEQLKNCWKSVKQNAKKKLATEKVLGLKCILLSNTVS